MADDMTENNSQVQSETKEVSFTYSEDKLQAFLCLSPTDAMACYTIENLRAYLSMEHISFGIDEDMLLEITEKKRYYEPICVANGQSPQNGDDGWYEFLFPIQNDSLPRILADGSVDYSNCGNIPSVVEGQEIVIYHPATPGKDGMSVMGELMAARNGQNLGKLRGKGFLVSEDGNRYTSRYTGKITYQNELLNVDQELVVDTDVNYSTTGNVRFIGDIHIRGNVLSGLSIVSEKGGIIVDGFVEGANLEAKKDIVLKNGMTGNEQGKVKTQGSILGKFFEHVTLEAGADISANAMMNCHVDAGQDIIVSGKFGVIVGGKVHALRLIRTMVAGNMAQVQTVLFAGSDRDLFAELTKCEKDQRAIQQELDKIILAIEKINTILEKADQPDIRQKKMQLTRIKVEKDTQISEMEKRKQDLTDKMSKSSSALVSIEKIAHPGTMVIVNGMKVALTEEVRYVEYVRRGSGLVSRRMT